MGHRRAGRFIEDDDIIDYNDDNCAAPGTQRKGCAGKGCGVNACEDLRKPNPCCPKKQECPKKCPPPPKKKAKCGCSNNDEKDVTKSCGFKVFLKEFMKKNCKLSKCEAIKKAKCKYENLSDCKKDKLRKKGCCPKPKKKCCDLLYYAPEDFYDIPMDVCPGKKSCHDKKDTCCKKRDPDDDNCCEPSGTGSLGFRNYYKMFRCRYPYYSKCAALAKAKCKYCQLGQKAKAKYRIMGCNPKICCKPRKPCNC